MNDVHKVFRFLDPLHPFSYVAEIDSIKSRHTSLTLLAFVEASYKYRPIRVGWPSGLTLFYNSSLRIAAHLPCIKYPQQEGDKTQESHEQAFSLIF